MGRVDVDQDGFIDYSEFLRASMDSAKYASQKNLSEAFQRFDKDASGGISIGELKNTLQGEEVFEEEVW